MAPRRVVAALVLGAWGTGIAMLARRDVHRSDSDRLASVALRVAPGATWFSAERGGIPVGFASITVDTAPRQLLVTEYQVWAGEDHGARYSRQMVVHLSRGLTLQGVERSIVRGPDSTATSARALNDSIMWFQANGVGDPASGKVHHSRAVFIGPLVPLLVALREPPRVGSSFGIDLLDLDRRAVRSLSVRIAAESVFTAPDSAAFDQSSGRWRPVHHDVMHGWRLVSSEDSALDTWVDELGQPILIRAEDGITLRRAAFELAFENWRLSNPLAGVRAHAGSHVVSSTLVAAGAAKTYTMLDTLRVRIRSRLAGSPLQAFHQGDVISAVRPDERALRSGYMLPLDERTRRARWGTLRAEPGIEVDDPRIVRLATRLRGAEHDPAIVARRILRWVHDSLLADPVEENVSAVQGLNAHRGDCDAYSRLFIALARAAGIPTRGAAGLLYAGGNFYYHTWAQVILDRRPIDIDPKLGQMPADAAHLRSMTGSLERQPELMRALAGLDLQLIGMTPSAVRR